MDQPRSFNPTPFAYHEEVELTIQTLNNHGAGLGRIDNWVVVVPFTLPGERVRGRIFRNHKNYSEADLVEVIEPSPDRIEPRCPLFTECGGCQYQHLDYPAQLQWKQRQIAELMEHLGEITHPVEPTHPSPRSYHYRSKLTPHYPSPREDKTLPIGFLRQGQRRRLIDVPQCPIATESINQALPAERERLRAGAAKLKRGGTLLLRDTREGVITDNTAIVTETLGKLLFQFPAGEFFQNNPFILPELVDYTLEQAADSETDYLIDAYCGVGMFALAGASRFKQVAGVEVNAAATRWANANIALNRINNVEFIVGKAEAIFAEIDFPGDRTAMIIDPPRAGCDQAFLDQLIAFGPRRLVYVSCGPDTQARDLKILLAANYQLERIQPFDLFPQTRHIESVATLRKKEAH